MTSDACNAILDCVAKVSGVFAWVLQIDAGQAVFCKIMQRQKDCEGKPEFNVRSVSQTLNGPSVLHIQLQTEIYNLYTVHT